jgi:glycosyltransferase involved in cell wall biosynthesis
MDIPKYKKVSVSCKNRKIYNPKKNFGAMKRVLMTSGFFRPHRGGTERYIEELSDFLSCDYAITILSTNTEGVVPQEHAGTVEVIRLPVVPLFSGTYPFILPTPSFFSLMKNVLEKRYDVVVTHTRFFQTTFLGYLISIVRGIPLLHMEHGAAHITFENKAIELVAHALDHICSFFLLRRAEKVGAVSHASSEFLRHIGARGDIECIPNFVDTRIFSGKGKSERLTVIYVGRLVERKGVSDLLAIWPDVKEKYDAQLLIIGEGEARERLESLASRDVFFLGEKDASEVARVLASSDLFVNPSLSEGLPSTVLEACACGLPVVATDVGGTGDVIGREFLVSPRDRDALLRKILLLLGDERMRREVGKRNRETVEKEFCLEVVAQEFRRFIGT